MKDGHPSKVSSTGSSFVLYILYFLVVLLIFCCSCCHLCSHFLLLFLLHNFSCLLHSSILSSTFFLASNFNGVQILILLCHSIFHLPSSLFISVCAFFLSSSLPWLIFLCSRFLACLFCHAVHARYKGHILWIQEASWAPTAAGWASWLLNCCSQLCCWECWLSR